MTRIAFLAASVLVLTGLAQAEPISYFRADGGVAASDAQKLPERFDSQEFFGWKQDLAGNVVWTKPLGPFQDEFGSGSSPILVDGKLLLNEDHDLNSFLMAIDPATGKTLWQTSRAGATRSYSTPIVWNVGGRKLVIV